MSRAQDILLMAVIALYALLTATRLLSACSQVRHTKSRRAAVAGVAAVARRDAGVQGVSG